MTAATRYDGLREECQARPPSFAIVLGSGMGPVIERLSVVGSVPFGEVPALPSAGVGGHKGCLTLGDWQGQRVLVFEGRIHFYEGHSWETARLPVRIAHALGARTLILTNAAGGIRDDLDPGCLMILRDHVTWTHPYCWRGEGEPLGPPRPSPYAAHLRQQLHEASQRSGVDAKEGVYAQLTGPCYETPAEIRALRTWGADAVGMSTAHEAMCAHELGMECAAISGITNKAAGLSSGTLSHADVLANSKALSHRMADLLESFLRKDSIGLGPVGGIPA